MQIATRSWPVPRTASLTLVLPWAAAAVLFVPFGQLLQIGTLTRFQGDDYCWAADVRDLGYFGFQARMYETMFGRWASTGLGSALAHLGPSAAGIIAPALLSLWLAAFTCCAHVFTRRLVSALIASQLTILTIVALTGSRIDGLQAVYWQTAAVTYIPPLVVAAAGIALCARSRSPVLAFCLAFVAAGFNEAFMALELAGLAAILLLLPPRRIQTSAALLGGLVCAAIVALAPGNDTRIAGLHEASPTTLMRLAPLNAVDFATALPRSPLALFTFLAGAVIGGKSRRPLPVPQTVLIVFLLAIAAVTPSVYAMKLVLPRTTVIPFAILVSGLFLLGARTGGRSLPRPSDASLLMLGAVVFAVLAVRQFAPLHTDFREFTRDWAIQERQLASASGSGGAVVVSPVRSPVNVWQVDANPVSYVNLCVARYYGLGSVRTP
ncbi:MAG TPA: DUF6056 family protein [Dehalococcoidia bacterium]